MCKVEDIIKCEVTGINSYGIFVKYSDNYNGLIHISEVSDEFVSDINKFARVGDLIYCRILEIDEDNKQLKLSIKHIDYKKDGSSIGALESIRGFKPLKEQLPLWTEEKLMEYENNKNDGIK